MNVIYRCPACGAGWDSAYESLGSWTCLHYAECEAGPAALWHFGEDLLTAVEAAGYPVAQYGAQVTHELALSHDEL